ncbi:MAG: TIGR03960 family B12-binding radical SAM protein, partial [Acetobacteraceae bacterium]|nr:TIGR03960 family B12-binding radical SAM protein [Acetobacteraceae bacterium]
SRPDALMERVFAPWPDMEEEMRRRGIPLFALESREPVKTFDVLGFSLQYEMTYTNLLSMLDLAGVPLQSRARGVEHPLVCAGGPGALNPEPLADFVDFFLLGDGEEAVHDIVREVREWKQAGRPGGREGALLRLAGVEGVYVPGFYGVEYESDGTLRGVWPRRPGVPARVRRRVARLRPEDAPRCPLVPAVEVVFDRAMVEVFRGCTRGCRFCQAGVIYRPVRERPAAEAMSLARQAVDATGYPEVSLVSLSSADYSAIREVAGGLARELAPRGVSVSLPSLRADAFSVGLASDLHRVRKSGLTFAPEAGTERLRRAINKSLGEEEFLAAVRAAQDAGWQHLKLYFMVGLPGETEEDLGGIVSLVERVLAEARGRGGRRLSLSVSVAPFVPKAHTPFQWEPQLPVDELGRRLGLLRSRLRRRNVRFSGHDPRLSLVEAVFARGDRRLGAALEAAFRLGCRFDAWSDRFRYELWLEAFERSGADPGFYAHRRRPHSEVLPWDHLDAGVSRRFLEREHDRALRGETTPDCRGGACEGCGACGGAGRAGGAERRAPGEDKVPQAG